MNINPFKPVDLKETIGVDANELKEVLQGLHWVVSHRAEIFGVAVVLVVAHFALKIKAAFGK
jgi:hypothetical protein